MFLSALWQITEVLEQASEHKIYPLPFLYNTILHDKSQSLGYYPL